MNRRAQSLLGIGVPLLSMLALFVLLAFSLLRLGSIERNIHLEAPHNMLWAVSQAQVAALRLSDAAMQQGAAGADAGDLTRLHGVLLSRLHLLDQGPQRRQMQDLGFAAPLDQLSQRLPDLQARLAALQGGDARQAQAVRDLLAPFGTVLGQASNQAMVAGWDGLSRTLRESRRQLGQIIVSLLGIVLAGIALCIHFLRASRKARRHADLVVQERAFSQLIVGAANEGIVAVDLQTRCTLWNPAAQQLFQRPAGDVMGQRLGDLSSLFQEDRVRRLVDGALQGRAGELLDEPFGAAAPPVARYLDVRCHPLRDGSGIIGCIVALLDVTQRHAAQREIAMHRVHLEELVRARTEELHAALERERNAAELSRNFGAMISHQFRTPLAIVDSALQRLIRRADNFSASDIQARATQARSGIARLAQLIESTLDAARLDSRQIESRKQACDLAALVTAACQRERRAAPHRRITLRLPGVSDASSARPRAVVCDPVHVDHILGNLLSNAIKYTQDDQTVEVIVTDEADHAECAVSNPGTLPALTDPDALFERYHRGENAGGRSGIGLGLYMARALARLQGGDVVLTERACDADETIRFVLRLPYAPAQRLRHQPVCEVA